LDNPVLLVGLMLTDFEGHAFPLSPAVTFKKKKKKVLTSEEIYIVTKGSSHKAPRSHQFSPPLLIFLRSDFPSPLFIFFSLFLPVVFST